MIGICTLGADQNIVKERKGSRRVIENAVDCLLEFCGHITQPIECRFKAIGASGGSATDIKITLAGRFESKFKLTVSIAQVNFGEADVARGGGDKDFSESVNEVLNVGHLVFIFWNHLIEFFRIKCKFERPFCCKARGTRQPFCCLAQKGERNLVLTMWLLSRPVRVKRWGNSVLAAAANEVWRDSPMAWTFVTVGVGVSAGVCTRARPR